jgi:hypothetical protein
MCSISLNLDVLSGDEELRDQNTLLQFEFFMKFINTHACRRLF